MMEAASVSPIPTILPGDSTSYETVGDTGAKTLWVCFSLSFSTLLSRSLYPSLFN